MSMLSNQTTIETSTSLYRRETVDVLKVSLLLSSNEPPVPARTTRPSFGSRPFAEERGFGTDTSNPPLASMAPVKVETPDTLRLSNSVCPSISTLPLKSTAPVKVDTPDTFKSSSSVCPSTSKFPFKSALTLLSRLNLPNGETIHCCRSINVKTEGPSVEPLPKQRLH